MMAIEFEQVAQIRALVAHSWETACIVCLMDGPLRYNELGNAMRARSIDPMPEGILTRTLKSLCRKGLVEKADPSCGKQPWALTHAGRVSAATLERITAALPKE